MRWVFWMLLFLCLLHLTLGSKWDMSITKLKQQIGLDAHTGLSADCFYFTSFPFNFCVNQYLCSKYVTIGRDAFYSHYRHER